MKIRRIAHIIQHGGVMYTTPAQCGASSFLLTRAHSVPREIVRTQRIMKHPETRVTTIPTSVGYLCLAVVQYLTGTGRKD